MVAHKFYGFTEGSKPRCYNNWLTFIDIYQYIATLYVFLNETNMSAPISFAETQTLSTCLSQYMFVCFWYRSVQVAGIQCTALERAPLIVSIGTVI